MLAPREDIDRDIDCIGTMNRRQIIPSDMTAPAIAHVSVLALLLLFSDVHPFGVVPTESIVVEIVADIPETAGIEKKPEPAPVPWGDGAAGQCFYPTGK